MKTRYYHVKKVTWQGMYIFRDGQPALYVYSDLGGYWRDSLHICERNLIEGDGAILLTRCEARRLLKSWYPKLELLP